MRIRASVPRAETPSYVERESARSKAKLGVLEAVAGTFGASGLAVLIGRFAAPAPKVRRKRRHPSTTALALSVRRKAIQTAPEVPKPTLLEHAEIPVVNGGVKPSIGAAARVELRQQSPVRGIDID